MTFKILFASFVIAVVSSSSAAAQYCNIVDFKGKVIYKKDVLTNLSYIDQIASRLDKSDAESQNIGFLDIATMNSDQASRFSSSLQRILDVKWSQREQEWILISQLDANGLIAYHDCLEKNEANLWLKLGEGAGGKLTFLVDMAWHPHYNAPNPSKINYRVLNAKVTANPPKTIIPGESDQFGIERIDPYQPVEIGVRVDGQIYPNISLPAFPEKKLVDEKREAAEYHDVYGGGVDYITQLCVTVPNTEQDAVIVPNTLEFSTSGVQADRASLTEMRGTRTMDSRSACTTVRWGLSAADGRVFGTAHVRARVMKAIPVEKPKQFVETVRPLPLFEGQD